LRSDAFQSPYLSKKFSLEFKGYQGIHDNLCKEITIGVIPAGRFILNKSRKELDFRTTSWLKGFLTSHPASIHKKVLVHTLIVLMILTGVGLSQFRSYGISYDEPAMRMHGIATAKYVADILAPGLSEDLSANPIYDSIQDATTHQDGATHQVFFELGLVLLEYQFGLTYDKKNLYEFRHLATFMFCSIGLLVFFVFLYWRFKRLALSYLGVLFIVLSPRIFADMFYNNKDAVFMTTYLVAGVLSIMYIAKRTNVLLLLSAATIGLSTTTRVIGIIPAVLVCISILAYFRDVSFFSRVKKILLHISLTVSFTVLFHPYYWDDPIRKLVETFATTAVYPYRSCSLTLGSCLETTSLPWFYIPLWISATIPILFLITFVFGICRIQFDLFSDFRNTSGKITSTKIDSLVVLLVALPVLIAIVSNTTLYNGWRHFYFIYPFLAYFGVRFFSYSSRSFVKKFQFVMSILLVFTFSSTALWMHTNRPLQHLYFNQLAGDEIAKNWDLDYFSLSNRQALDWIVSRDSRDNISIQTNDNSPLYDSAVFLSKQDINRVNFLWYSKGISGADYVIVRQDLNAESKALRNVLNSRESGFQLVYKKLVGKTEVFSIYAKES
jgi:hypothetical protein